LPTSIVDPYTTRAVWGQDPLGRLLSIAGAVWQQALSDAWGAPGSDAPKQNQNALKHGVFAKQAIEERKQVQALLQQSRQLLKDIE
jgi:hypothetical protein